MSDKILPKSGGLQINRYVGQTIHFFVAGVEVRLELRQVKGQSAKIAIIADPDKVAIRRGEQMEDPWRE